MNETGILQQCRLKASKLGWKMFRNNVGMAWQGNITRLPDGSLLIKNPRPVKFGLIEGSGDLIGFETVMITDEMKGRAIAVFRSVETKSLTGLMKDKQIAWMKAVNEAGGIAIKARSDDDIH